MSEAGKPKAKRAWQRIDQANVKYKTLQREMQRAGISANRLSKELGQEWPTVGRKIRGGRGWKLWECVEIKRILKSDMPLEELFKEVTEP